MPIQYVCIGCREELYLPDHKAGQLCACPRCRLKFLAPAPNCDRIPESHGGSVAPPRAGSRGGAGGPPPLYPLETGASTAAPQASARPEEVGSGEDDSLFGMGDVEPGTLFGEEDPDVGELFGGALGDEEEAGQQPPARAAPGSTPQPTGAPAGPAGYPSQGYPPHPGGHPGYPPQGYPPGYPQQAYPPQRGYTRQAYPPGYAPPPGYPPNPYPQGYPPPGYPPPGYPPQGYPQGYGGYPPTPPGGYPPQGPPGPEPGTSPAVARPGTSPAVARPGTSPAVSRPAGGKGFKLVCLEGLKDDTVFAMPGGKVYLMGRDRDADIKLLSTSVSRRQARIDATGSSPVLIDLGSANGTKVNGDSVDRHPLMEGDLIKVGKVVLRFQSS